MRTSSADFLALLLFLAGSALAQEKQAPPTAADVTKTIAKVAGFAHDKVARHGGYVYLTSSDLTLREAEGIPDQHTVWVQPPGTPSVGAALLRAYQATGDETCKKAAYAAAICLTRGQLHSGGWNYQIHFDPAGRQAMNYRLDLEGKPLADRTKPADKQSTNGWFDWKRRQVKGNITTYDDDTSESATRFLMQMDAEWKFQDKEIHDAALYSLASMLGAQYPNGGWSSSWDRFPEKSPSIEQFPVKKAEFPAEVSQKWPKDFTGCYCLNDNQMSNCIDTLLLAYQIYKDEKYLFAAKKAGDFLILAQCPAPQSAWAQQYDANMHPCWCRAFEPPAVTGGESQKIITALMQLYEATLDKKYLAPIPAALAYLKKSELPGGKLARFYELKTNRPIYFERGPNGHQWTYEDTNIASGYGYIVSSSVDQLQKTYESVLAGKSLTKKPGSPSAATVQKVIAALDDRGAWLEPGSIRDAEGKKQEPKGGIIRSDTFIKNLDQLSRYVAGQSNDRKRIE
jgi:hypothetical protein